MTGMKILKWAIAPSQSIEEAEDASFLTLKRWSFKSKESSTGGS
jgi:hypothetical protein